MLSGLKGLDEGLVALLRFPRVYLVRQCQVGRKPAAPGAPEARL